MLIHLKNILPLFLFFTCVNSWAFVRIRGIDNILLNYRAMQNIEADLLSSSDANLHNLYDHYMQAVVDLSSVYQDRYAMITYECNDIQHGIDVAIPQVDITPLQAERYLLHQKMNRLSNKIDALDNMHGRMAFDQGALAQRLAYNFLCEPKKR